MNQHMPINSHEPPANRIGIKLLVLVGLFFLNIAPAMCITDCRGIVNIPDYKIAVDEVTPAPAAGTATSPNSSSTSVQRLTADLQTQVEEITVEEGGAIVPVPCVGRRPQSEVDFNRSVVEVLNDNNVVLEIWGVIDDSAAAGTEQLARLQFVLVPVRYYEHFLNNSQTMGGVYLILYTPLPAGSALAVFERSSELRASVALSMALKKIKEGHNELALKYLCKAETFLKRPDSRIPQAKRDALLQYTRGLETLTLPTAPNKAASLLTPQAKAEVCSAPAR